MLQLMEALSSDGFVNSIKLAELGNQKINQSVSDSQKHDASCQQQHASVECSEKVEGEKHMHL